MSSFKKITNLYSLMKSQWWSNKKLKELQEKRLRSIIKFAYENIPFYYKKYKKANVHPEDIKKIRDLSKIPFIDKNDIQKNLLKGIISPNININKCWTPHTGGSTGIPLKIVYDKSAEDFEKALALRPNLNCGQKIIDKWAVITNPSHIKTKKWFQHFGFFSPFYISSSLKTNNQISELEKFCPNIIDGFPSAIYLIAKEIEKRDKKINPRIIFSTAEILTNDVRNLIESVFQSKVFDQFGCVELGRTAWECKEHNGYHIDMESIVMEFINNNCQVSPGEKGEIVYTGLYNYAMPLIRYRIGDVGIPSEEKCNCGRGLSLMKLVEGRKDDFILTEEKGFLSPRIFSDFMKSFDGFEQYKIIQDSKYKINVLLVKDDKLIVDTLKKIESGFKKIMGENINCNIKIVDEIQREKSGKLRKIMSKIPVDL